MFKIKLASSKVVKEISQLAGSKHGVAVFTDGTEALFSFPKHTEIVTEEDGTVVNVPKFCDAEGNLKVTWRTYKTREGEVWLTDSEPKQFENRLTAGIRLPKA